ncbi:Methyltransferase domain-containing protein [Nocardioides terrae]|uniref:Methyltransferase domain-containing protein n=1 Tax=Nocardioides terrae TaxID=574651 RepID=A0A1I1LBM4_9ACTN|nr:class I SAM-dependent methyltransferase [Nocardioides terrae]SFC67783.1 Methyltransferase domain-containing protein [Nocardioides terrae]
MTTRPDVHILDQRTPEERARSFLPGMGRTWLLPLYDVFTRAAGVGALHARAAELADVRPGQSALDVGCGTGNLALAVLARQPAARVTGLDPDGDALRRAARKARRRGVSLTLDQGYADRLPAEDASLDHVLSSLALHHLDDDGRTDFAREALRVLRPGGRITIVDLGGGSHDHTGGRASGHSGLHGLMSRVVPARAVAHNHGSAVPELLLGAGFSDAREVAHVDHRFGRVTFVQATRA